MATDPMTLEQALAYLKPDPASQGSISLRAPMVRQAVEVIEAEIAALKSRSFEDGARWMRERATQSASFWIGAAGSLETSPQQAAIRQEVCQDISARIATLPLKPEGERNGL